MRNVANSYCQLASIQLGRFVCCSGGVIFTVIVAVTLQSAMLSLLDR